MPIARLLIGATVLAVILWSLAGSVAYAQALPRGERDATRGTRALPRVTGAKVLPRGAEDVPRGESVTTRPRPELTPLGMRVGGFLLFPKLSLDETYDDNIFRTEEDKKNDYITTLRPEFALRSDWNNHALNLEGDARIVRFGKNESENVEDYNFDADGRFDVTRDIFLFGSVGYSQLSEDRGSPDEVGGIEPTEYNILRGSVRYFHKLNRVNFRLDAGARNLDYDDTPRGALPTINNDDRDHVESSVTLRAGYEIVPEYEAFIRGEVNNLAYLKAVDDNGFSRDSNGYELVAGVTVDLTGVTFGDLFAGFREQRYDDDNLDTIGGITWGADITWNVTALTTIQGGIVRQVEETTSGGSSGFFATQYSLSADHELLRNLLLNAHVAFTQNDYEGIKREDQIYEAGVSARYLLNRNFYASAGYKYTQRERVDGAPGDDADYKQNVITVGVELQM